MACIFHDKPCVFSDKAEAPKKSPQKATKKQESPRQEAEPHPPCRTKRKQSPITLAGKGKKNPQRHTRSGLSRKEAIRTPDPYVPNVVRYQLRYFPFCGCKVTKKSTIS